MTGDDDGRPIFWALDSSGVTLSGAHTALLVVRPAESEPLRIRSRSKIELPSADAGAKI
jgi:hypothetical protein